MARIKLKFYDKTYIIEYANRLEVKEYFAELKNLKKLAKGKDIDVESGISALKILVKAGLVEHHKDEMPSDQEIERWLTVLPNQKAFYEKLMSMIQEVVNAIESDTKNVSWEVEQA